MSACLKGPANPMWKNAKLDGACKVCGTAFKYFKGSSSGKYCGRKCYVADKDMRTEVGRRNKGRKHSDESRKRMSIQRKGVPKPPEMGAKVKAALKIRWDKIGRKTSSRLLLRTSKTNDAWRNAVIAAAKGHCADCGCRPSKIDVHHILPFSVLVREVEMGLGNESILFDTANGVALCRPCHKIRHKDGTFLHQLVEGRLFMALEQEWKSIEGADKADFADFYRKRMEDFINHVKTKLPEK